jgi:hypothetical protein
LNGELLFFRAANLLAAMGIHKATLEEVLFGIAGENVQGFSFWGLSYLGVQILGSGFPGRFVSYQTSRDNIGRNCFGTKQKRN